jgi:hypothetical protein
MLPEERLNDLAAREIAALEAEGIMPTAAEVVKLNALGWAIETPTLRRELSRGVPQQLCPDVYLWPLTIQAADWHERVGEKLAPSRKAMIMHPGLSSDLPALALAYAMAHAYSEGDELDAEGDDAADKVIAWASGLKCTAEAFGACIAEVVAQQDAPDLPRSDETGKRMTAGEFSVYLASRCGGTPEFWERRCSIGYAATLLSAVVHQSLADGKPITHDAKMAATMAMGMESDRIRKERAHNV